MSETIKTYKGTDQNMRCHGGYQYELGKTATDTDAIRCGDRGFHSCEAPLDVLHYFPLRDSNRYFEAEAGGKIDRTGADDSKLASSELTLKAEIGIPGLMKAHMAYVKRTCDSASEQTASGSRGNAAASGDMGNAAASGYMGTAVVTGMNGSAAASGKQCIAVAWGMYSKARGALGCWLVLSEHDVEGKRINGAMLVQVDGEAIKPDTWYTLKNGEIVEARID